MMLDQTKAFSFVYADDHISVVARTFGYACHSARRCTMYLWLTESNARNDVGPHSAQTHKMMWDLSSRNAK